ncbi:N-acetylmuramoyl-L-alanine amidase [Brevibacillus fluminis]|uniref:N-acetylmuramoyl-L-alanine amidase n=1 Tax=Brevibacillus fluminis TaxID=511487 RepID=A0A3M8DR09_9BACL|nr:N-acetylmuramoyl-L-alanine amidase [Brevibacillus fluminis]
MPVKRKQVKNLIIPFAISSLLVGGIVPFENYAPLVPPSIAFAEENDSSMQTAFEEAAKEFGVPVSILMSVSYNITNWEHHDGQPSFSGGYGVMHLTDLADKEDGEQHTNVHKPSRTTAAEQPQDHTLKEAADLLGLEPDELRQDPVQNIRGAAALLAQYAKDTVGSLPEDEEDWYGAVAKYSGSDNESDALSFADQVYQTINDGAERVTSDGEEIVLAPKHVKPNLKTAESLHFANKDAASSRRADCPRAWGCDYYEAPYVQLSDDPGDYSNYDLSNRPESGPDIRYIVIHDTEVDYDGTIKIFQDPQSFVSTQYVIRSKDGHIAQTLENKNVGWHAGNWYFNSHSIGLEHEGFAMEGASWYTEVMYRNSAKLVRYLGKKYKIPLDRNHILGHDEMPGLTPTNQSKMHEDPGPFWDWAHYMELINEPIKPAKGNSNIVTIKPDFKTNRPKVSDVKKQSTNFVYLHTEPDATSPLIVDPAIKAGRDEYDGLNWGNKAATGRSYYLADHKGSWDAIWYGGQKAWFYNPQKKNTVAGKGILVTPKEGLDSISVYGHAFPDPDDYPEGVPQRTSVPLQYTIEKGQVYVAAEKVKSNIFVAPVYVTDPDENVMVYGKEEYYEINFNHRVGFVRASDVDVIKK